MKFFNYNIGAFIFISLMAEDTRHAKIDDALRSLNEFRKEIETQIRELNNTITRFMQAVDQRMEHTVDFDRCTENPQTTVQTPKSNNYQHRSIKIDVPRFDGTHVSGWILKIEQFF